MGILSELFGQMKKTLEVQALEEARNVPTLMNSIRMCRDEELREKMASRIGFTMCALENSALSGDAHSMLLYNQLITQFQSKFEEYDIRYKN